MNKLLAILIAMSCTGCSTIAIKNSGHGKFYIHTEVLPVITNDKKYGDAQTSTKRILLGNQKLQYQYIYRF
jgi:hypothetical protein